MRGKSSGCDKTSKRWRQRAGRLKNTNSRASTSSAVGLNFRHTGKNKSKQTASARGLDLGGVGDKETANEGRDLIALGVFDYQMFPTRSYLGQASQGENDAVQSWRTCMTEMVGCAKG